MSLLPFRAVGSGVMKAARTDSGGPGGEVFAGIPDEGLAFLEDLEEHNTKEFFEPNKQLFRDRLQAPFEALLASASGRMEAAGIGVGPPKVFRVHRDLRFSKDKTPYKTNMAGYVRHRPAGGADADTGYYVSFAPSGLYVGGGLYRPARPRLERVRAAVASGAEGPALAALLAEAAGHGLEVGLDPLQRVPKPYPADHPRADLLRARSLVLGRHHQRGPWLVTTEVLDRLVEDWRRIAPLHRWLDRCLTGP
jgi:uncharacterized protein (TIGR02453 family)